MSKLIFNRNKSGFVIVTIMIFLLYLSIPIGIDLVETNEALFRIGEDSICNYHGREKTKTLLRGSLSVF
jgi:hypothetical protein